MSSPEEVDINDLRENFYYSKDETSSKKAVNPRGVASAFRSLYHIITLKDTEEMFYYDKEGIYRPGARALIKKFCESEVEDITCHTVKEIVGHVERGTYFDRTAALDGTEEICLLDGIVNVLTGKRREHSPDDVFFTQLPFAYNPDATCPLIDAFVSEVFSDQDRELAYEIIAYTLIPGYPIQKAFAFLGGGNNGKSTFLNLIRVFLGPESVSNVVLQALDGNRFASADLYRKRANLSADIPSNELHRTSMFKMLTGRDWIHAERKHGQPFEFENYAKLFFSMNQLPLTEDTSDAFYRRWVLINFPNKFEGDRDNLNKLVEISRPPELAGLFNRCLKIIPELLRRKTFSRAGSTEVTREKYTRMSDSVYCFVEDQLKILPGAWIRKKDLLAKYADWCREQKITSVKERKFKELLLKNLPSISEGRQLDDQDKKVHVWEGIWFKGAKEVEEDRGAKQVEIGDY